MKHKRKRFFGVIAIVSCIVILTNIVFENASAAFPANFYINEHFSWEIENGTTTNNMWYNVSSFSFIANWHVNQSGTIFFAINNSRIIDDETYLYGKLTIGNLTLYTDNKDIGFNLALSCYSWYGGLVSLENNWEGLHFQQPFNSSICQISYEKSFSCLDKKVEAYKITYDDGFQKSILIYEPIIGLLLFANSSFEGFWLQMHLKSTTIPLPALTPGFSFFGSLCLVSCMVVLLMVQKRKS